MGRQQITIEDNSPVIIDRTGNATNGMNGALLNRPAPLPKAGWQGYAPIESPGASTNLPKVPGPTKQKASSSKTRTGNRGNAGALTNSSSPSGMHGYKPYATYSAPATNPNAADLNTSTNVKGSLLHWRRVNRSN